jgi:hypothetical protein
MKRNLWLGLLALLLLPGCRLEDWIGETTEGEIEYNDSQIREICSSQVVSVDTIENDAECATPMEFSLYESSTPLRVVVGVTSLWDGTTPVVAELKYKSAIFGSGPQREWNLVCTHNGSTTYVCDLPAADLPQENLDLIFSSLELRHSKCKAKVVRRASFLKAHRPELCEPFQRLTVYRTFRLNYYGTQTPLPELKYKYTGP